MQGLPRMTKDVVWGRGIGMRPPSGQTPGTMPMGGPPMRGPPWQGAGNFRGGLLMGRGGQHRMPPPDSPPLEEAAELIARNFSDRLKNSMEWEELRHAKMPTLTREHTQTTSQFYKNLKSSEGPKLNELKVSSDYSEMNFVQFLQEIAGEQRFDVTYVDIEEKSASGMFQCLIELSTFPVAVVLGSGASPKDAKIVAALNALQYLKLFTKNYVK